MGIDVQRCLQQKPANQAEDYPAGAEPHSATPQRYLINGLLHLLPLQLPKEARRIGGVELGEGKSHNASSYSPDEPATKGLGKQAGCPLLRNRFAICSAPQ